MNIGIDLGGSHIGVGIINEYGKIIIKKEKDMEKSPEIKNFIVENIIILIKEALKEIGSPMCAVKEVGIGVPGFVENGKIKKIYNLEIDEFDLASILNRDYGVNVKIANDAKCAALAEKQYGALKEYDNEAVFLCLGTGIGGATFYKGMLVRPNKSAGSEYGHMVINKDGIQCKCGNKGCFEKYASIRTFKENIKKILNLDENISSKELLQVLKQNINNEEVNNYIDEYIDYLLLGISNIVKIIEPEVICLGGGFIYFEQILYTRLIEKMNENKYKIDGTKIILAKLGNDAGIIGATLI